MKGVEDFLGHKAAGLLRKESFGFGAESYSSSHGSRSFLCSGIIDSPVLVSQAEDEDDVVGLEI